MIGAALIDFPVDTWPEVAVIALLCATLVGVIYAMVRWM